MILNRTFTDSSLAVTTKGLYTCTGPTVEVICANQRLGSNEQLSQSRPYIKAPEPLKQLIAGTPRIFLLEEKSPAPDIIQIPLFTPEALRW